MSVGDSGGRRPRFGFNEADEARQLLFSALRKQARYQNIVNQDLRPLWRAATGARQDNRLFYELRRLAPHAGDDEQARAIRRYVEGVEGVAARTLRLTRAGVPPDWPCDYLHADVEPSAGTGEPDPDLPHVSIPIRPQSVWRESATLSIVVGPEGGKVWVFGDDGALVGEEIVYPEFRNAFGEWNGLDVAAHAALDRRLVEMRRSYERENKALGLKARNPESLRLLQENVDAFVAFLLVPRALGKGERRRFERIADAIGVDFPGTRAQKRAKTTS